MDLEANEYLLSNGIFSKPKKLSITPTFIEYQTSENSESVRVTKDEFQDVKYSVETIQVDMFSVGTRFVIDILYNDDKVLPIRFARYFWKNRGYGNTYREVTGFIGNYFLFQKIDEAIDVIYPDGSLEILDIKISMDKIIFQNPHHEIPWEDVGLKQYYQYFAIFDKKDPNIHRRITFYEWKAELLYGTLQSIQRERLKVASGG